MGHSKEEVASAVNDAILMFYFLETMPQAKGH
jgi:hypothetical protein